MALAPSLRGAGCYFGLADDVVSGHADLSPQAMCDEEEADLLDILEELDSGAQVMPSTHFRNIPLYTRVVEWLTEAGLTHMSAQCRSKFKRLKRSFFEAIEHWQGVPPLRSRSPHFESLHCLWETTSRPGWRDRCHASECCRNNVVASNSCS